MVLSGDVMHVPVNNQHHFRQVMENNEAILLECHQSVPCFVEYDVIAGSFERQAWVYDLWVSRSRFLSSLLLWTLSVVFSSQQTQGKCVWVHFMGVQLPHELSGTHAPSSQHQRTEIVTMGKGHGAASLMSLKNPVRLFLEKKVDVNVF